ncbi:PLDc N-terminal domain-containing protein [Desertivirga brevis]|uniref:PLDc N-terminal domain-containing protein n=1 Tax=Desertivirga brevis TaxID=2810310 RepID=UPI001A9765BF|nr:PLDc N-terminal domain-containing protein [Pedobacter sp. SYSU D00873]
MDIILLFKIGFPELVLIGFFGIIPLGLMLFSLVDVIKGRFENSTIRTIWILLILFLPILGSLLYLLVGRTKKINI